MLDPSRNIASLLSGVPVGGLVARLRWPCIILLIFSVCPPCILIFALHWATPGGLGEFALAYPIPLWVEVWNATGYWCALLVVLLWYASLQRDVVWMACQEPAMWYIFFMSAVFSASLASLEETGVHRSTWVFLPTYLAIPPFFTLIVLSDALPFSLRLITLRFGVLFVFSLVAIVAVVVRLPTAASTPGLLLWGVFGFEPVTNLEAMAISTGVLAALLAQGAVSAWLWPGEMAFVSNYVTIVERRQPAAGTHHAPADFTAVMPYPTTAGPVSNEEVASDRHSEPDRELNIPEGEVRGGNWATQAWTSGRSGPADWDETETATEEAASSSTSNRSEDGEGACQEGA